MSDQNIWPRDQYDGPGGGRYEGPGGGLYDGPGGGLYDGPGGGMYAGPCAESYKRNIPPWPVFIRVLEQRGLEHLADLIRARMPGQ